MCKSSRRNGENKCDNGKNYAYGKLVKYNIHKKSDLNNLISNKDFLENLPIGKFIENETDKNWDKFKEVIDFSNIDPIDFYDDARIIFIKGRAGIGKSIYLLWSIERFFENNESLRQSTNKIKNIIFLNPNSDAISKWDDNLGDSDPKTTILVLDALYRDGDTSEEVKNRFENLINLSLGTDNNGNWIGPFKVIITLCNDEFDSLKQLSDLFRTAVNDYVVLELKSDELNLYQILNNYLKKYDVENDTLPGDKDDILTKIREKSEGLPFYIHHLVIFLKQSNQKFSVDTLNEYPRGMYCLMWLTINKFYHINSDITIPLILLFLTKNDYFVSSYFLDEIINEYAYKEQKEDIKLKIKHLKTYYFEKKIVENTPEKIYSLNRQWKKGIRKGTNNENYDIISEYNQIINTCYNKSVDKIIQNIKGKLDTNVIDIADVFLCIDLGKISYENLKYATDIYINTIKNSKINPIYITYAQSELYNHWIDYAWKCRYIPYSDNRDERIIECYTYAFEKLNYRDDVKEIHTYATFLRDNIIRKYDHNSEEYKMYGKKIEDLFLENIETQKKRRIIDPSNYSSLAIHYRRAGNDNSAESIYQRYFRDKNEIGIGDSFHGNDVICRLSYANYLKNKGSKATNNQCKIDFFNISENEINSLFKSLSELEKVLMPEKFTNFEIVLENSYIKLLIEKSKLCRDKSDKIKMDIYIDNRLDEIIKKYPKAGSLIVTYANFLLHYGDILDKYNNGSHLTKAAQILSEYIKYNNKQDKSNYYALNMLASTKIDISRNNHTPINYEEATSLYLESANSFDRKHNAVALNELGKMYLSWGISIQNSPEFTEKLNKSKEYFNKSLKLSPMNGQNMNHISGVRLDYARVLIYLGKINEAQKCIIDTITNNMKFSYSLAKSLKKIQIIIQTMIEKGYNNNATEIIELSRNKAEKYKLNLGRLYSGVAKSYADSGDLINGAKYYIEAAKGESNPQHLYNDFNYAGGCYEKLKKYDEAINCFDSAKEIAKTDDNLNLAHPLYHMAYNYEEKGDLINAAEYYIEAAKYESNTQYLCGDFTSAGRCYEKLKKYDEAIKCFDSAKEIAKTDGNLNLAHPLSRIAYNYQEKGDLINGAKYYIEAAKYESNPQHLYNDFNYAGGCYEKLKKYDEAINCFDSAREIAKTDGNLNLAYPLYHMAYNYQEKGDLINAAEYYIEAAKYESNTQYLYKDFTSAGRCYEKLKKYDEANKCFDSAKEIAKQMIT
ncbi:tetratricopeptide repeat protein [Methanocorpusculum labreanum]|nr:hypothetical protein [Methanocorpusculum labreanum]